MSLQLSFSHVDRHAVWGARRASVVILLGFGVLVGVGALLAEPNADLDPAAIRGRFAASPCLPREVALGNSGDSYFVVHREDELAAGCGPVISQARTGDR